MAASAGVASIGLFSAKFLWHHNSWVHQHIDAKLASQFDLVVYLITIRLVLMGVNGITVGIFYQLIYQTSNLGATIVAVVVLVFYNLQLPYFNIKVIHRLTDENKYVDEASKSNAMMVFGALFEGFKPDARYLVLGYIFKRMVIAGCVGALQSLPVVQMSAIFAAGLVYVLFLFCVRPFVNPWDNVFYIFMETTEMIQSGLFLFINLSPSNDNLGAYNLILISIVGIVFFDQMHSDHELVPILFDQVSQQAAINVY